jgi:hypothetical protein
MSQELADELAAANTLRRRPPCRVLPSGAMRRHFLAISLTIAAFVLPTSHAAAEDAGVIDPENRTRPASQSEDLTERASHLFLAITGGDAALADDFFFPKEPFLVLKDVSDPGRYHRQLVAAYHRDIAALSRQRRSWDGARFVSFALGTEPKWVAPGKEYNKIGYYRTFRGKLRYAIAGREHVIEVGTVISWAGRWYTTHLLPLHRG